jgi:hypothetical protein
MANDPKENPGLGDPEHHGDVVHAHDAHGHAVDDHGHGHGHGDDAGEIIPESSPQDFMLTWLLSTGALLGFVMMMYFTVTGSQMRHLQPDAVPSMYVGGEAPHPPRAGEHDVHGNEAEHSDADEHDVHHH